VDASGHVDLEAVLADVERHFGRRGRGDAIEAEVERRVAVLAVGDPMPPLEEDDAPPATAVQLREWNGQLAEDEEEGIDDPRVVGRLQRRLRWERRQRKRRLLLRTTLLRQARLARLADLRARPRVRSQRARQPRRAFAGRPARRARAPGSADPPEPAPASRRLTHEPRSLGGVGTSGSAR
jgi:hypothetical protein